MSTVLILAPIVIGSWPAISGAAVGAAAALGFVLKKELAEAVKEESTTDVNEQAEVLLEQSEVVAQSMHSGQEMIFAKGNMQIRVHKDERGRCAVCASGHGYTKQQLKEAAEAFSGKLTQCFMYDRVMTEIKNKNFNVVNEEVMDDESVRIHVRRWMD